MIENNTDNVKLTFEQMQQVDMVQKILSNLQSECVNYTKTLNGLKLECDAATKENAYQAEIAGTVTEQIEALTARKTDLMKEIEAATVILDDLISKTAEITKDGIAKSNELGQRETLLKKAEADYNAKVEDFTNKSSQLLADQVSVTTAKDAFTKATDAVTW